MGRRRKKNRAAADSQVQSAPRSGRADRAATAPERARRWPSLRDLSALAPVRWSDWLLALALVVAVFLAYQPAWRGNFIWDDDLHLLKNPVLQPGGLARTWVPGTYATYWPVTSTAYWIQHQLWGLSALGFHLVNIGLHAVSAILIWRVLRLLRVPGGLLAAALFALHPVNVESVAWITQQKNTISLLLTLASVLAYLLDEEKGDSPHLPERPAGCSAQMGTVPFFRPTFLYAAAVALFALAALAKGMTLTLPLVLLACAWWQRGRIGRQDLRRVAPFC
jgi:hypothetical protein